MELTSLIIQIVATAVTMVAVGFGFLKYVISIFEKSKEEFGQQIARLYQRVDEVRELSNKKIDINHEIIHQKFLLKEIHLLEKEHSEKMLDVKFQNLVSTIDLNFTQLKILLSEKKDKLQI